MKILSEEKTEMDTKQKMIRSLLISKDNQIKELEERLEASEKKEKEITEFLKS